MRYWLIKAEDEMQANLGRYELVQPVVKCKDCKYRDHRTCTWNKAPVIDPRDFCSRGVKKDEE